MNERKGIITFGGDPVTLIGEETTAVFEANSKQLGPQVPVLTPKGSPLGVGIALWGTPVMLA